MKCPYCGKEVSASEFAEHHRSHKSASEPVKLTLTVGEPSKQICLKKGNHYVCFRQSTVNPKIYFRYSVYVTETLRYPLLETIGQPIDKEKLEREIAKLKKEGYVEVPKEDVFW